MRREERGRGIVAQPVRGCGHRFAVGEAVIPDLPIQRTLFAT